MNLQGKGGTEVSEQLQNFVDVARTAHCFAKGANSENLRGQGDDVLQRRNRRKCARQLNSSVITYSWGIIKLQ